MVLILVLVPQATKEKNVSGTPQVLGTKVENTELEQIDLFIKPAPELAGNLETPQLSARAALSFDLNSGAILYTKNFDQELPVASLTKLVTALVVVDKLSFNDEVVVERADTLVVGSNMGLVPGERIKVIDLLHGMLISSSNDAAMALSRQVAGSAEEFVVLMNQKITALGLSSSHFSNPVGLDSADNYSTTFDLGRIVGEFVSKPELARVVQLRQLEVASVDDKFRHVLTSTNELLIEDASIMGIKTGYTDEAKGNLVIRKKQGEADVVTIILGSDDREEDTRKLLAWVFGSYRW